MGKAEALREQALAKLHEAKALVDDDGDLIHDTADNQRKFDKLMAEFKSLDIQSRSAQGDNVTGLGPRADAYLTTRNDARPAFSSRQASLGGISAATPFGGWGEAFVPRIAAGVLENSGTVPVTVPLSTVPIVDTQRVVFLRQLLAAGNAPGGRFSYMRQTVRTNNAAVVAKGAKKPTSIYTLKREDDSVDVIAHLSEPIARQDLSDAPMLRDFVTNGFEYGLALELDERIAAAILAVAEESDAGSSHLVIARKAITDLQKLGFEPDGFVFTPEDWEAIELEALTTYAANPAMSPFSSMTRRLYGVPVVVMVGPDQDELDVGQGLLGAFREGATLFMTEEARIDWSEAVYDKTFDSNAGASDFERNMLRFRAEMRGKPAVQRPTAFRKLTLPSMGS